MEFEDVTGRPRPRRDVEAVRFIEADMLRNPTRTLDGHGPALIHYSVIRDVLIEALRGSKHP
jgi:hypothetical protein